MVDFYIHIRPSASSLLCAPTLAIPLITRSPSRWPCQSIFTSNLLNGYSQRRIETSFLYSGQTSLRKVAPDQPQQQASMSDHGDSGGHGSAPTSTGTHSPPSLVSLPVSRSRGPYGQKIPRHLTAGVKIRPPTSHLLETQDFSANENGFYFQSKAEADLSMTQAQWYSPANDSSMPQTDAEDRRVVRQLLSAAKNMSRAKDTLASAYRKKTNGYPDWAMEACAWDVLVRSKVPLLMDVVNN